MKTLTERFALYLKDVITYYNENGSLRRFSQIAERHKITAIPQELFFKFSLDRFPLNTVPNNKLCNDILDAIRARKERNKPKVVQEPRFKAGQVIAWMNPSGCKSIACVTKDDWAFQTLNYRGRWDETDRLWVMDSIGWVGDDEHPLVEPTAEELKYFAYLVCAEYEKLLERNDAKQTSLFE